MMTKFDEIFNIGGCTQLRIDQTQRREKWSMVTMLPVVAIMECGRFYQDPAVQVYASLHSALGELIKTYSNTLNIFLIHLYSKSDDEEIYFLAAFFFSASLKVSYLKQWRK